jgi:hypothetical protein
MDHVVGARQFLPVFRSPADVHEYKRSIDPTFRALDGLVDACAELPETTRASWKTFSTQWRAFYATEESWWHTVAQWEQCERYEEQVANWQRMLGPKCGGLPSPQLTPDSEKQSPWTGAIVAASVAVGLVAVVVGVRAVAK